MENYLEGEFSFMLGKSHFTSSEHPLLGRGHVLGYFHAISIYYPMSHFPSVERKARNVPVEARAQICLEGLPSTLVFPCLLAMENDNNEPFFFFSIVEDFPPRFKRLNFPFFSSYIQIGSRNAFSRIFRDFLSSFLGFLHVYRGFIFVLFFSKLFLRACLSEKNVCVLNRAML